MKRALQLARQGWGRVHPNPLVGAVVVTEDGPAGEGFHREFGAAHAEVRALEAAGPAARGSTLYLNLEPCRHHGKTPPCTEAIVEAGVERVVVGCRDPHEEAQGGVEELRRAGIRVEVGVRAEEARRLNASFLWRQVADRPFVSLKYGLSLDAGLARREGERTQVTGRAAGRYVHRLRAGQDAVLVGRRTATVDDPELTARGEVRPRRPARRVVLDPGLRIELESRLVSTAGRVPVWVVCGAGAEPERRRRLEQAGVRVLEEALEGPGHLDPERVVRRLAREGIASLLVEGGGRVGSSMLRSDVVDRLHLVWAPVLFGPRGVPAFPDPPETPRGRWLPEETRSLGDDLLWVLDRARTRERIREVSS